MFLVQIFTTLTIIPTEIHQLKNQKKSSFSSDFLLEGIFFVAFLALFASPTKVLVQFMNVLISATTIVAAYIFAGISELSNEITVPFSKFPIWVPFVALVILISCSPLSLRWIDSQHCQPFLAISWRHWLDNHLNRIICVKNYYQTQH